MITSPEVEQHLRGVLALRAGVLGLLRAWPLFSAAPFAVHLQTPWGEQRTATKGAETSDALTLRFRSRSAFQRFVEKGVPTFSILHALRTPWKLLQFARLAPQVQRFLYTESPSDFSEASRLIAHLTVSLEIAVIGLRELGKESPTVAQSMGPLAEKTLSLGLADSEPWVVLSCDAQGVPTLLADRGARANARIQFRDLAAAFDSIHNRVEPLLAVGSGAVRVQGRVDLADLLSDLLHRVDFLMKPRHQ